MSRTCNELDWRDLEKAGGRKVMSFRCIKNIKMFGKSKNSLKLGGERKREYTHECRYPWGPEEGAGLLELELQVVWVLGTELRFSWSTESSHNCWAVSPCFLKGSSGFRVRVECWEIIFLQKKSTDSSLSNMTSAGKSRFSWAWPGLLRKLKLLDCLDVEQTHGRTGWSVPVFL